LIKILHIAACILSLTLTGCLFARNKQVPPYTEDGSKKKNELSGYDRRKVDYLFIDGLKEKMKGNFPEAIAKFQHVISMDPNAPAPYYEIANIYHSSGRSAEALTFAKKAASLDQENDWYLTLLAECYKEVGKYSDASSTYEKALKLFPDKIDLYYDLAMVYLYASKPEDAIDVYNRLESKIGVNEELSYQKEKVWLRVGNQVKAIAEIQKLIDINPKESKYYVSIAQVYAQMNNEQKALEYFQKAISVNPNNGMAHLYLSDYYRQKKNNPDAFKELKLAFYSPELDVDAKTKIVLEYYGQSGKDTTLRPEADTLARILREVHPTEARSWTVYGDFLYRDKKFKEARDAFLKALEFDKSRYAIWHQVLVLDSELDDYNSMDDHSKQVLELFPNEPAAYLFSGVALSQLRKHKEAVEILLLGKDYVIDNNLLLVQFYSALGDAYFKLKEYQSSDNYFDRALAINPEDISVLNNYAYFLSLRGENLVKAEKMAQKVIAKEPNSPTYLDTYAWILYRGGKYADAKNWLEKALQNGGDTNGNILEHYGDVLYKQNNINGALEYWEKARKTGKGSELLDKKIFEKKLLE
jgi:tetratricopeptide (TPR) repeat protein